MSGVNFDLGNIILNTKKLVNILKNNVYSKLFCPIVYRFWKTKEKVYSG